MACSTPMSPPARNPRTACTSDRKRWFMPTITRLPYFSLACSTRSTPEKYGKRVMVVMNHHPLTVFLARLQHPLDARDGEGERALAQHVHARGERRDDVDLVQVVGRTDRYRVGAGVFQDLFDVVERLLDLEPGGEGLRL